MKSRVIKIKSILHPPVGSGLLGLEILAALAIVVGALLVGAHPAVGLPHHLNILGQGWPSDSACHGKLFPPGSGWSWSCSPLGRSCPGLRRGGHCFHLFSATMMRSDSLSFSLSFILVVKNFSTRLLLADLMPRSSCPRLWGGISHP